MSNKYHDNLNVLITATNFPDRFYPYLAPWSKMQADSLFNAGIAIEVVVPRPYTIPLKYFPYSHFHKLPLNEISDLGYSIHYPRFFYLVPKKMLFGITGNIYSKMIGKYLFNNFENKEVDVVHSRFVYLDGYGCIDFCKKLNVPLVADVHGPCEFGEYLDSKIIKQKHIKALNFIDKFLCVAEWQIEVGKSRGIPEDKLEYVPLGIDFNKFEYRDKKELREKYGIDENTTLVLFVGQLIERKGLKYLISALPTIIKKYKTIKFVIIGSGPEKNDLIEMCYKTNMSQFVDFKGGVPENTMLDYYWMADIFILPSLAEGQPMVIYEAMATENAIIGTNVGGIPDQIKENVTGYLIPPEDSKAICNNILYLLDNPDICVQMGTNSRKRVIEKGWTWECYAKRVLKIYRELA